MRARNLLFVLGALSISCGGAAPRKTVAPAAPGGPMIAGAGNVDSQPATVASGGAKDSLAIPEQLVIEGSATVDVADVRAAVVAIRDEVARAGGRIIAENLDGSTEAWSGHLKLRLPPDLLDGFFDFLDGLGEIRGKKLTATDVSKTLYDQEIQLENLTVTLERLRRLLEGKGLKMAEVLAIEKEMTRLRGEIEAIKGQRRYLQDRVAYSTIDLRLERSEGVVLRPEAKFYPGPRFVLMTLLGDAGGRQRSRAGFGVVLQFPTGANAPPIRTGLELDILADSDGAGTGVIATTGIGAYSDFFGAGRRRFLNPYISFRIGYGYLDGSRFAVGGGAGVELFKHERFMIDFNIRAIALIGSDTDTALVSGLGAVVAF
jgi:hypothetical protein